MAASTTLKGVDYTKVAAVIAGTALGGSYPNAHTKWNTKLRVQIDTYEADADYDAGSVITMGYLPKGARVLGFYWASEAQGVAVTADVTVGSTAATAAEAFTDMTSATQQLVPATEAMSNTELSADSAVKVTNAAAAFKSGKSVILATFFVMED